MTPSGLRIGPMAQRCPDADRQRVLIEGLVDAQHDGTIDLMAKAICDWKSIMISV